jgi:hypothetical protein
MKVSYQADLEKAKKAVEDAQGAMTTAASQMFAFYSNLLLRASTHGTRLSSSRWEATHL